MAEQGELAGTLEIRLHPNRETVIVEPVGELDLATVADLVVAIDELRDAGFGRLAIDLGQLTFIDVAGVSVLDTLTGRARRDGWQLHISPGPNQARRLRALVTRLRQTRSSLPDRDAPSVLTTAVGQLGRERRGRGQAGGSRSRDQPANAELSRGSDQRPCDIGNQRG